MDLSHHPVTLVYSPIVHTIAPETKDVSVAHHFANRTVDMFKNAFRLPFRLLGIPLYLDITFLIILPLLAWLIGSQLEEFILLTELPIAVEPLIEGSTPFLLGLWAALALFVSVVIHELGHAITARRYDVETERITLWLLGGMAQFREMPKQRGAEAVVAIAGPITSFALGLLCWFILQFVPTELGGLYFVVIYTMYMNILLAIFNMIPALPLDGGRVLRSLLHLRMSRLRATQISASISRILAVALGLFGLLAFNIFLILIAFFIYMAVTAEAQYALFTDSLSRYRVGDLMTHPVTSVHPEMTVDEVIAKMFAEARLAYPVRSATGEYVGQVTIDNLREFLPGQAIGQVMQAPPEMISADSGANELFDKMIRDDQHRLLVQDNERIIGIVTKTDLMRALQIASGRNRYRPQKS